MWGRFFRGWGLVFLVRPLVRVLFRSCWGFGHKVHHLSGSTCHGLGKYVVYSNSRLGFCRARVPVPGWFWWGYFGVQEKGRRLLPSKCDGLGRWGRTKNSRLLFARVGVWIPRVALWRADKRYQDFGSQVCLPSPFAHVELWTGGWGPLYAFWFIAQLRNKCAVISAGEGV